MSYAKFVQNIDKYVGKVMRFTFRMKTTGKTYKTERYVWDCKEFGKEDSDSLVETIKVEYVRDGELNKNIKGIVGVV